ncbi:hypothetical protein C7271_18630 [filamentous cyanobacterium CCP5]|nr:hypothetical protein C7271_18630 [filamentous cyanobacterium CCP5]
MLALTTGSLAMLGLAALPITVEANEQQADQLTVAQSAPAVDPEDALDLNDTIYETDTTEGIGEEPGAGDDYEEESYGGGTRDSVPTDVEGVDEESAIDLDDATSETDAHEGIGEEPGVDR